MKTDTEPQKSVRHAYEAKDPTININQNITAISIKPNENVDFTGITETTTPGQIYESTFSNESQDQQKFKVTEHELQYYIEIMTTTRASNEEITESQV